MGAEGFGPEKWGVVEIQAVPRLDDAAALRKMTVAEYEALKEWLGTSLRVRPATGRFGQTWH